MSQAVEAAQEHGVNMRVGNLLTSDNFYSDGTDGSDQWKKMGVLAVEMESAGLYLNAMRAAEHAYTYPHTSLAD